MKTKNYLILVICLLVLVKPAFAQKELLQWGTYFGGKSYDNPYAIVNDHAGNIYITGATYSYSGMSTSGAYKTYGDSIHGDAFLAKFNDKGQLLWATYFGGDKYDGGYGLVVDKANNLYMLGISYSLNGIATNYAYQSVGDTILGALFLTKFNPSGYLVWSTYYGGDGWQEPSGIAINDSSGIFISGATNSDSGIATYGAYQTTVDTDFGSAFLSYFDTSGYLIWGTYFGGSNSFGRAVATDSVGNVFLTGNTFDTSGIATSGSYQTIYGGNNYNYNYLGDAFLAKFDYTGNILCATYFGGSGDESGNKITIDKSGYVYIVGNTNSKSHIATLGAYNTVYDSLTGNSFLAKFSPDCKSLLWATYCSAVNCGTDQYNNVYISGGALEYFSGKSYKDPTLATHDGYDTLLTNWANTFLSRFSSSGYLKWSTYYGGQNMYDLSVYQNSVYVLGDALIDTGVATLGAYQTKIIGQNDAFIARFNLDLNDVKVISVINPSGKFCNGLEPVKIKFENVGFNPVKSSKLNLKINRGADTSYNWTGNILYDSSAIVAIKIYNFHVGYDTIKVWQSFTNGIKDSFYRIDTAKIIIKVNPLPTASFTTNTTGLTTTCKPKDSLLASYSWSFGDGTKDTAREPKHTYASKGIYTISLTATDTNGCSSADSLTITIINTSNYALPPSTFILASPNPFSNILTLKGTGFQPSQATISITDIQGRPIYIKNTCLSSNFKEELNLSQLQTGLYILRIISPYQTYILKISKL